MLSRAAAAARTLVLGEGGPAKVAVAAGVAGRGLFAAEPIRAGDALALYPGVRFAEGSKWPGQDASYVLNLHAFDGAPRGCIDARGQPAENPRRAAHVANHPPRGTPANVTPAPFFWAEALGGPGLGGALDDLPNTEHGGGSPVAGALLLALRDVPPGNELFLDYRLRWRRGFLRPRDGVPDWYWPAPPA